MNEPDVWSRKAIAAEAGLRLSEFVERVEAGIRTDRAFLAGEIPGITKRAKRLTLEAHEDAPLEDFAVLDLRLFVFSPRATP